MTEQILTEQPATSEGDGRPDAGWWRQATVYQIYPRSFADANGDGIGDLQGIISKVSYLEALGVDAVWLSPFYPSALADGGYDVDDYRDVDPSIGTLEDFDALSAALHAAGIKVIVDIVPNHTSDRHEWFTAALASVKGSPERARYLFRDGAGEHGELPPTPLQSIFGGSAWTRITEPEGTPGQWYLHMFAKEQPDLNWDNADVHADFLTTLRFWCDRGVDGFRVDVAHGLKKDLNHPLFETMDRVGAGLDQVDDGQHPLWDRDDVHDVYAEWRRVFDEYDPPRMAVAEAWARDAGRRARYASTQGLGQAFNFDLLMADFDADQFRATITRNLSEARDAAASSTWVFSNHDVIRHTTRYGLADGMRVGKQWLLDGAPEAELDRDRGLRRARAATLFMLGLPGSAYLYQGEELGLHEVTGIPDHRRQDPAFFRNPGVEIGRDGCRVPLPWQRIGTSFGFGIGRAHLPQPAWFGDFSVEAEDADPASTLFLYRAALALRRELQAAEELTWIASAPDVLHYERPNGWQVVTNFGTAPVALPAGEILLATGPISDVLPGETTVWLRC